MKYFAFFMVSGFILTLGACGFMTPPSKLSSVGKVGSSTHRASSSFKDENNYQKGYLSIYDKSNDEAYVYYLKFNDSGVPSAGSHDYSGPFIHEFTDKKYGYKPGLIFFDPSEQSLYQISYESKDLYYNSMSVSLIQSASKDFISPIWDSGLVYLIKEYHVDGIYSQMDTKKVVFIVDSKDGSSQFFYQYDSKANTGKYMPMPQQLKDLPAKYSMVGAFSEGLGEHQYTFYIYANLTTKELFYKKFQGSRMVEDLEPLSQLVGLKTPVTVSDPNSIIGITFTDDTYIINNPALYQKELASYNEGIKLTNEWNNLNYSKSCAWKQGADRERITWTSSDGKTVKQEYFEAITVEEIDDTPALIVRVNNDGNGHDSNPYYIYNQVGNTASDPIFPFIPFQYSPDGIYPVFIGTFKVKDNDDATYHDVHLQLSNFTPDGVFSIKVTDMQNFLKELNVPSGSLGSQTLTNATKNGVLYFVNHY